MDKYLMDEFVEQTVAKYQKLNQNRNTGGAHRIHNGLYDGSVWIHSRPRLGVFTIETTGDVPAVLNSELVRRFGSHRSENSKGYKLWHIENKKDLEEVIAFWANM